MTDREQAGHRPRAVLVTGGAGFIGSNLVRHLLDTDPALRVVNYDALTYAGSPANLADVAEAYPARYRFVEADICDDARVAAVFSEESIDTVIHLAAESHVDRSITGPGTFLHTNVTGTFVLLQAARGAWEGRADTRFHHVSTDEVFGSLGDGGYFSEETAYAPSSPYSASKASSDHIVRAWGATYGLPVTISNCSNNYGPYQFPEKLIPLILTRALREQPLPVYGDGQNVRDWLHVEDHCRAIDLVVRRAADGSTYLVGGNTEMKNLDLVQLLCDELQRIRPRRAGHYRDLITFVEDRRGHDRRYAIDSRRIRDDLGWTPRWPLAEGLRHTIEWYLSHEAWSDEIRRTRYSGERLGT